MQLFVGGERDGARIRCELRPVIVLPVPRRVPVPLEFPPTEPCADSSFRTVYYELIEIRGPRHSFYVYAKCGMTADDVLKELISKYPREELANGK